MTEEELLALANNNLGVERKKERTEGVKRISAA
jgi:hypothetical protein